MPEFTAYQYINSAWKSLIPILSALGKWGMSFKNGGTDAGFDLKARYPTGTKS